MPKRLFIKWINLNVVIMTIIYNRDTIALTFLSHTTKWRKLNSHLSRIASNNVTTKCKVNRDESCMNSGNTEEALNLEGNTENFLSSGSGNNRENSEFSDSERVDNNKKNIDGVYGTDSIETENVVFSESVSENLGSSENIVSESNSEKENSSHDEDNPDNEDDVLSEDNTVIFSDSGITRNDILLMLKGIALCHSLSDLAQQDIVGLLGVCAGFDMKCSKYKLQKHFLIPDKTVEYTFFCDTCFVKLGDNVTKKFIKNQNCKCEKCDTKYFVSLSSNNYFLNVDVSYQIKNLFENRKIQNYIKIKIEPNDFELCDIYDGGNL
ncbi:hypothetical protein NQ314_008446 [Rhamnusium bicolor]|uniref:Uncharacterized protein n=1 Tax=Rhamnusium bicolor TaxID=1586634 RepID=A0AAV8YCM3_9CUCU|nr:hypothetical protein NQ314_008446 [Rhamnusium bicolor]